MNSLRTVVVLLAISSSVSAQDRFFIDWDAASEEALSYLSDLVQIDAVNPPGDETRVVEFLKAVLEDEGLEPEVFWDDPTRANLVVRIRGNRMLGKERRATATSSYATYGSHGTTNSRRD